MKQEHEEKERQRQEADELKEEKMKELQDKVAEMMASRATGLMEAKEQEKKLKEEAKAAHEARCHH